MGEAARRNLLGLQPKQMQIDGDKLADRICSCGGKIFTDAMGLKELPPLLSPSGKYETVTIKVGFFCVGCGKLMSLRPEEPKEEPTIKLVGGN